MPIQDKVFLKNEGDNWFQRNSEKLKTAPHWDPIIYLINTYNLRPAHTLEIGCSNGWRLAALKQKLKGEHIGIEPSLKAIKDGQKRYPEIILKRGLASDLPVKKQFDLVIVSFVLHWVSRESLIKTLSEIDRVLVDGGYLIIADFSTPFPTKNQYHHLPKENVFTYKQQYNKIFTATNLYSVVAEINFNHDHHSLTSDGAPQELANCCLLKKSLEDNYFENKKNIISSK